MVHDRLVDFCFKAFLVYIDRILKSGGGGKLRKEYLIHVLTAYSLITAFVLLYLIYTWGNQEFERSKRKNPAKYANDK